MLGERTICTSRTMTSIGHRLTDSQQLQLATCKDNIPHAALMSYTYIPSSQYNVAPAIIMTSTLASRKTINIRANPAVSLLVNDCEQSSPHPARRLLDN